MSIIDDARKHSAVDALYQRVDAATPITIEFVSGNSWSSATVDQATTIEVGSSKYPAAALFHELLHAQLKIDGYRQHLTILPTRPRIAALKPLIGALDNELQHHRMFAAFSAAGFTDGEFYDDSDPTAFARTRRELRKMSSKDPLEPFLLKLLTVIAPGGHGSDDERRKLRNFLFQTAGPTKAARLIAIENHFKAWAIAAPLDPGPTLHDILLELGDMDGGWLGASEEFPSDGVFTGQPFDMSVAETFYLSGRGAGR
jgi:hypothetical protein